MNILTITYFLNGLLMVLIPIGLGLFFAKKFHLNFRLWFIGAGTFLLSQVGHLPFNAGLTSLFQNNILPSPPGNWQLIFNAVVLGLSAGLWEEIFRYLAFRFWAKDARSWGKGLMMGAGHGGVEAIILGFIVLANFAGMVAMKDANISSLVPADQLAVAQEQLNAYWSAPWYNTLLGVVERIFALAFHLSASVLVLQVFLRKQLRWLWAAIVWHTLLDGVAVFAVSTWGVYVTEALLGLMAILSIWIIFRLRSPEPIQTVEGTSQPGDGLPGLALPEIEENSESLDQTRYQ